MVWCSAAHITAVFQRPAHAIALHGPLIPSETLDWAPWSPGLERQPHPLKPLSFLAVAFWAYGGNEIPMISQSFGGVTLPLLEEQVQASHSQRSVPYTARHRESENHCFLYFVQFLGGTINLVSITPSCLEPFSKERNWLFIFCLLITNSCYINTFLSQKMK